MASNVYSNLGRCLFDPFRVADISHSYGSINLVSLQDTKTAKRRLLKTAAIGRKGYGMIIPLPKASNVSILVLQRK
jgi:hypothetical protein